MVIEPIVVMKSLQHFQELTDYESECYFARSANGWMTKDIFVDYALAFSASISCSHLRLPKGLRDREMLLVVDGHKTRVNVLAAAILILNGIDVIVLRPHSSHLIQMFDVGIACALKTAFKNELEKRIKKIMKIPPGRKLQAMRIALVESFINAAHPQSTPGNILSGFGKSGVSPLHLMKPLRSQFAVEAAEPGIYHTVNTGVEINKLVLTWPQGLDQLSQIEFGKPFSLLIEFITPASLGGPGPEDGCRRTTAPILRTVR
jgi:hypothetical protein